MGKCDPDPSVCIFGGGGRGESIQTPRETHGVVCYDERAVLNRTKQIINVTNSPSRKANFCRDRLTPGSYFQR